VYELNDADWQVVDKLAQELARLDLNVAAQASTYLGQVGSVKELLTWLAEINANQEIVSRSGQTFRYYVELNRLCKTYFQNEPNYERANLILGWAIRVARYYKKTNTGTQARNPNQPPSAGKPPFSHSRSQRRNY
jgi:hypothetical protein